MLKKFLVTIGSRYLIAVLNLAIVLLSTRFLGVEGLGFTSLFVLCIALNQQICSFVGGGALVYLTPRHNVATLMLISYFGATSIHVLLIPVYVYFKPFDPAYFPMFLSISLINVFYTTNLSIMLGKEKVEMYNLISFFQVFLLALVFGLLAFKVENITPMHYVIASGISYFMAFAGSSGIVLKETPEKPEWNIMHTLSQIAKFGFFSETGNIMQLLAYRLNYILISKWLGLAALGEFSLAVQLTEGLRIFSKGVATVEYSYFSNTESFNRRVSITRKSIQASFIFTIVGLAILLCLPASVLTKIFGSEFHHTRLIVSLLAPGILFLSAGTIISPFFSGQGKHYINAIGSLICFVVTAGFAFLLIPLWGLPGAAIVNSLAYIAMFVYLFLIYRKHLLIS